MNNNKLIIAVIKLMQEMIMEIIAEDDRTSVRLRKIKNRLQDLLDEQKIIDENVNSNIITRG